jgi:tRNA nucleotidyltransferase (CCA-adding enzyme)
MPIENPEDLVRALRGAYPELVAVRGVAPEPVYLVGGAVRDLLLGRGRADIDLVVIGDPTALATQLGATGVVAHERFRTAKVVLDGHELDIAAARTETYPEPGELPVVEPAANIEADLARRDFTINAIAVPLDTEPRLIDPHGGREDLARGLLRVLHPGSFADDPTRAIRAARYAARFGFSLEPGTEELLKATDFATVSVDRRQAELLRLAAEPSAPRGFVLLAEWGLLGLREGGGELAARVGELLASPPWSDEVELGPAVLAAALGPAGKERELLAQTPGRPSQAVELAARYDPVDLILAWAQGAEWLDDYMTRWRTVELEIDGDDLIAAGIPEGEALGRGLRAARRAKLDGEIDGRDQELATAIAAARDQPPPMGRKRST